MSTTTITIPERQAQPKHDIHKFRTVTQLTDQNWIRFKFEILAALDERALKDIFLGNEKEPLQSDITSWSLWHDKDVSARTQIIQNLSEDIQPSVFSCTTSSAVWNTLHEEYESSNLDKIANIRLIYDTVAFVEGTAM